MAQNDSVGEEMVTIPKREHLKLLESQQWLECLEAAGVDNWPGIDFAHEIWREDNPNEDDE